MKKLTMILILFVLSGCVEPTPGPFRYFTNKYALAESLSDLGTAQQIAEKSGVDVESVACIMQASCDTSPLIRDISAIARATDSHIELRFIKN